MENNAPSAREIEIVRLCQAHARSVWGYNDRFEYVQETERIFVAHDDNEPGYIASMGDLSTTPHVPREDALEALLAKARSRVWRWLFGYENRSDEQSMLEGIAAGDPDYLFALVEEDNIPKRGFSLARLVLLLEFGFGMMLEGDPARDSHAVVALIPFLAHEDRSVRWSVIVALTDRFMTNTSARFALERHAGVEADETNRKYLLESLSP